VNSSNVESRNFIGSVHISARRKLNSNTVVATHCSALRFLFSLGDFGVSCVTTQLASVYCAIARNLIAVLVVHMFEAIVTRKSSRRNALAADFIARDIRHFARQFLTAFFAKILECFSWELLAMPAWVNRVLFADQHAESMCGVCGSIQQFSIANSSWAFDVEIPNSSGFNETGSAMRTKTNWESPLLYTSVFIWFFALWSTCQTLWVCFSRHEVPTIE
jgi:hypothetical protein